VLTEIKTPALGRREEDVNEMRNPDRPLGGAGFLPPLAGDDDLRIKTHRISSPERWEIKQMIAAGSLDKRALEDLGEEVNLRFI